MTSKKRTRSPSESTRPECRHTASANDEVVRHSSKFLSRRDVDDDSSVAAILESVWYLVTYLEPSSEVQSVLTREDVATILLPWAVASLVRSQSTDCRRHYEEEQRIHWRILLCCFDHCLESILVECLPQSTVTKLVRIATIVLFQETHISDSSSNNDNTTSDTSMIVSNCCLQLLKRYRPSFEVACHSLFKDIEHFIYPQVSSLSKEDDILSVVFLPKHQYNVVCGVLELIHTVWKSANVKRSFLVLSSTEMLLRLGRLSVVRCVERKDGDRRVKSFVETIVKEGLFHPVHHMDGFRTMEELRQVPSAAVQDDDDGMVEPQQRNAPSVRKGCYQWNLFQSLRTLLSPTAETNLNKCQDIDATANLVPILVHGFFNQVQIKSSPSIHNSGVVVASTEADAKLQFSFWTHITIAALDWPFLNSGFSNAHSDMAFLQMISDSLQLVLSYDAYSPSYSDPDEALVSFLRLVTRGVLCCVEKSPTTVPSLMERRSVYLLASIRTLLLLNHRLLHEKLSNCIVFTCHNLHHHCNHTTIHSEGSLLLSTIVKTYTELRQIGYFLSSTRNAFINLKGYKYHFDSMNSLLSCVEAMDLLTASYQMLPSGQLHEIWDSFDTWILMIISEYPTTSDDASSSELFFAIRMFMMFIKHIRAGKHNSIELRDLCETTMTSSVGKLLDSTDQKSNSSLQHEENRFVRYGIDLCGWLVDLHTRSCFWIDGINVDGDGSAFLLSHNRGNINTINVLSYLRNIATNTVQSEQYHLWMTRWKRNETTLIRLSSTFDKDAYPSTSASLLRLALHRIHQLHSMIYYCKVREHEGSEREGDQLSSQELLDEAKLLVNFVIYDAKRSHEASFESETLWPTIAQSLGTWAHYADPIHISVFLDWFFSNLSESDDETKMQHEAQYILTLLRDASFYEVKECSSIIMKKGVMCILHEMIKNVESFGDDSWSAELEEFRKSELGDVANSCLHFVSQVKSTTFRYLDGSFNGIAIVMTFVLSAPLDLLPCEDNINLVDIILCVDILTSKIYETVRSHSSASSLLKILCASRSLLAQLVPRVTLSSHQRDTSLLMLIIDHAIKSSLIFHDSSEVLSHGTGKALAGIFTLYIDNHANESDAMVKFLGILADVSNVSRTMSPTEFNTRASLIRFVTRQMNILQRRQKSLPSKLYQPCINTIICCNDKMWTHIIENTNATSILLGSEILTFLANSSSISLPNEVIDRTSRHIQQLFHFIASVKPSSENSDMIMASHYFLSCILTIKNITTTIPTRDLLKTLLDALQECKSPLLEAALCSLLRDSLVDDIEFVISYLSMSDKTGRPNDLFAVKIYHLLIQCAKKQGHIKYLSKQATHILLTSMNILQDKQHCNSCDKVSSVTLFSTMMSDLLPRKELLLLSGREIAMICCNMSAIFNIEADNIDAMQDPAIFSSCCSVVSSLVANYPKQLYGCPNVLFGLLLAMLDHILQSKSKGSLSIHASEYAKICELLIPHKEIFKKHTIGLILRFIHSMNSGIAPATKSKLMPSIHGLLDMCSDYEMRQINAMIDVPSKALFAPVFQSYQKNYQYHGI